MFRLLKFALIIAIITLASWHFIRDMLPKEMKKQPALAALDHTYRHLIQDSKKLASDFIKGDHHDAIRYINTAQLKRLLDNAMHQNKVTVIYLYDFQSQISSVNLPDIAQFAKEFEGQVSFIVISLEEDKTVLASKLNPLGSHLGFVPLAIKSTERSALIKTLNDMTGGYGGAPYLAIMHHQGNISLERPGLARYNIIRNSIVKAIELKSQ